MDKQSSHTAPFGLWSLFCSFFKIGALTFGGGYAMIPMIQHEIIDRRKWIAPDDFIELLSIAQTSPGPISLNTGVFVGYKLHGLKGAIAATLGSVLPSFGIVLLIAVFFTGNTGYPLVESAFRGMRPAVVALIVAPVYNMLRGLGWFRIVLALAVAVLIGFLGVSPVWFLIAGAVGGAIHGFGRSDDDSNRKNNLT